LNRKLGQSSDLVGHSSDSERKDGIQEANGAHGETRRHLTKSARAIRPAPAPPMPPIVKLKPPIPAPRRFPSVTREPKSRDHVRRCRALYDCSADNPDELSFQQGDIIVVTKERIAGEDDTWMVRFY
uniref:SH3 domain-containing protein n=1 Tax=Gongylonema pulchrum TaxID=637853 RepID=A0A183EMZ2_9BILA